MIAIVYIVDTTALRIRLRWVIFIWVMVTLVVVVTAVVEVSVHGCRSQYDTRVFLLQFVDIDNRMWCISFLYLTVCSPPLVALGFTVGFYMI